MLSDDDSGICSSPLKRTYLRAIISSDSESEPSPGCSNVRGQPPNSARKLDSSDSGEELEDELRALWEKEHSIGVLGNKTHTDDDRATEIIKEGVYFDK